MIQPRRGIVFATAALDPILDLAAHAERAGFDRVWTTEYLHRDAIARALAIAMRTRRIGVGTGVAYAFTRLPLAMAALAADVQRLSSGRFALGLSSGTRGVRRWYGGQFEPPATAIAEYVAAVRTALGDDPDLPKPPRIHAAALNPAMTRTVAATCDGLLLHPLAVGTVHLHERVLPALARGARDRTTPLEVVAWCITSIDPDEDLARQRARAQLAFYLSTPSYRTVAEGTAWEDVPARVREAFDAGGRRPDWSRLAHLVPEELVDELAIVGTPSNVGERAAAMVGRLSPAGVTELVHQTVGVDLDAYALSSNCIQIIEALGPATTARSA
jgi:alkanesulfonate monooxygenase SsuD/methylene tetrahydromethanopterin reductase-like flavin-dependent oxidoreductase (luciferase family)